MHLVYLQCDYYREDCIIGSYHFSVRDRTKAGDKDVGFDLRHLLCKKTQNTVSLQSRHQHPQHHLV